MKAGRITIILLMAASLTACEVESGISSRRTNDNLCWLSRTALNIGMDIPVDLLYQMIRVDDYIKASEEERKDVRFADISWNYSQGVYLIGKDYQVTPDGSSLFSKGSFWSIRYQEDTGYKDYIETTATADSLWDIQARMSRLNVKCTGMDKNGKALLDGTVNGTYGKDNDYWAGYQSDGIIKIYLTAENTGGDISYTLSRKGKVGVNFYNGDSVLDWCTLTYSGTGNPSGISSRK